MDEPIKCMVCRFHQVMIEYWWKTTIIMGISFVMFLIGAVCGYWFGTGHI